MLRPIAALNAEARIRDLLAHHRTPLMRFVQGMTVGRHHIIEDVVQETMIRAWRHLDRLPTEREEERRWLFTVAHRLVIDDNRRRKVRPVAAAELTADIATIGDETSATALANDALRTAFQSLGARHRHVIEEIYVRNRRAQEVAESLNIPIGTVRSRAHYAVQSLRLALAS